MYVSNTRDAISLPWEREGGEEGGEGGEEGGEGGRREREVRRKVREGG